MIDGAWGAKAGLPYFSGSLDDGKTNTIVMLLAPYLCMDGMNEKGLASSIQYLDVKEGSEPVKQKEKGKETINIIQANRFVLDNCASIDEAVELLSGYNLSNLGGNDFHLFMTERSGKSAIIEWVENKMVVSEVDASTNFYLTLDDAADCWYEEGLKEAWNGPAETTREYHYGYGHGYERFKTVVSYLDSKLTDDNRTIMTEKEALSLLAQTRQEYVNELCSSSLYSAIYNLTDLTLDVWSFPKFDKKYSFSFAK